MHGVARSSAALTIVNALPTGVGCAVGIDRFVTVEVSAEASPRDRVRCEPPASATPLVLACLAEARACTQTDGAWDVAVRVRSDIPSGKGLKSSSAVATATLRAAGRAWGAELEQLEAARLAARVGRAVGVSATGALDDALAGLASGFVTTDNRTDTVLRRDAVDPEWTALVCVPAGTHPPAPSLMAAFRNVEAEGRRAADAARAGRYADAMQQNGALVARALGYDRPAWSDAVVRAGAVAFGISGLGPAVGVIVPRDRADTALHAIPPDAGERFPVQFAREAAP